MLKLLLSLFILSTSILFADKLLCNVVNQNDILKIKCKYKAEQKDYDRNITISWTSPTTHQDDRLKTIFLPAFNISAYDYRYFDGRADGEWIITAVDESTNIKISTKFIKKDFNEATTMSAPCKGQVSITKF